jgi:hypothetical protein
MSFPRYAHPEFGYFWPAPGLRRALRLAMFCFLFAALVGGPTLVTRGARSDWGGSGAWAARLVTSAAEISRSILLETTGVARQIEHANLEGGRSAAAKTACEDLGYPEGTCAGRKPRRVRVANDSPAIARVSIGRTVAPIAEPGAAGARPADTPERLSFATTAPPSGNEPAAPPETDAGSKKLQVADRRKGLRRISDDRDRRRYERTDAWLQRAAASYNAYARVQVGRDGGYARNSWRLPQNAWKGSW